MTAKLEFRRATQNDPIPWAFLLDADGPREVVETYLARSELWLAEHDDKLVAQMVLLETRPGVLEILNMAVLPQLRSQGIGTMLLTKAQTLAKSRGLERLEVGTGNNCCRQPAFYQRFGFRIFGVDRDFFVRRWASVSRLDGVPLLDLVRMEIVFDA